MKSDGTNEEMIEKKSPLRKEGAARFDRRGASSSPDQRDQIGERENEETETTIAASSSPGRKTVYFLR